MSSRLFRASEGPSSRDLAVSESVQDTSVELPKLQDPTSMETSGACGLLLKAFGHHSTYSSRPF